METQSENADFSSKGQREMTDAAYASELIQETFPTHRNRNVALAIWDAFEALKRHERSLPKEVVTSRQRQWTERRVRSLWFREARRVDHYEIQDLTAVAVMEARRERERQQARDQRLAALIAAARAGEARQMDQR